MDKETKELQDWFDSLTLEEFLEQTETCEPRQCIDCGETYEGEHICIYDEEPDMGDVDRDSDYDYSEWNAFMKKEYGNLPERPDLPEPSEDELPW
tara:strand:+ start:167 stop:451 length:285 start_codon:yes stop_codon:yes gene_type:complete